MKADKEKRKMTPCSPGKKSVGSRDTLAAESTEFATGNN